MTTVPAWLHLSPDTTPAGVVVQAVDKATGGHEDDETIARYVVEALTASGHLSADAPTVARLMQHARGEHAQGWSEATAYLHGLAASTTDDKETATLWRAAEKLRAHAKELREAEAEG